MQAEDRPAPAPVETAAGRRALVIVNAASRNGADATAALDELKRSGFQLDIRHTSRDEATDDLIIAHAGSADLVVCCGGDGTLHHAARGLLETGLPLGIVPLGTGNDLARTLGLPLDPVEAARVIAAGRLTRIDVGDVNGRAFFNVASIGLSVTLARKLDPAIKRRWGRFGYMLASLRVLFSARPFRVRITHDGATHKARTYQVSVGNGRYYGGGNAVHHEARIDDGVLHLYSLEARATWRLVLLAPFFRAGTHGRFEDVRDLQSGSFTVETNRPRSVNADGEIVTTTPATFTLRRRAVTVFTPPD